MSSVSDQQPTATLSPGLMSVVPIFYVGWSDSVLSPSEMKWIHKKIKEFDFLTAEDKKQIIAWTDPTNPPGDDVFKLWVQSMKKLAGESPLEKRISLASMGLEMAKNASRHGDEIWKSARTKAILEDLEEKLGIENPESYRVVSTKIGQQVATEETSYTFDPRIIQDLLDDQYIEERTRLRTLLKDPEFSYRYARDKEQHREQVLKWCTYLAQQGYGALSYPEAYGGKNSMAKYAAIFETLAHHDLSLVVKFGVQFGLFGGAILNLGTKKHHDKYLQRVGTLELPGCFAMTETGHGSNVRDLETTAIYDPQSQEFVIHSPTPQSNKEYIGNALHGRLSVVFAQLITHGENHGIHAFLVPLRDQEGHELPGITVRDNGHKMGLNGVDNGKIWYDQVRIPRENLLDRFGSVDPAGQYSSPIENPSKRFFTMLATLVGGRICVARAALSAAKSSLSIAIQYALRRRQFAPSSEQPETLLLDYPTHQWRLLPKLAKAYALDFALTDLTAEYEKVIGKDMREVETLAAGLKAITTWYATETIQECREACGGKGYLYENRFADLKADSDIFTTFEGDNTVLLQLVAKGLLSNFKQELHDDGFRAVLRMLSNRVSSYVVDRNFIATRKTDAAHLLDPDFHKTAFQFRQQSLLYSLAQRMRNLINRRMNPYDAFLRGQMHMLNLARAFVDHVVLESFYREVQRIEKIHPNEHRVLLSLYQLFALHTIYENRGWYLEQDFLHSSKSKAIRRMISKLVKDLRVEAKGLVEGFGISKEILGAEIIQ